MRFSLARLRPPHIVLLTVAYSELGDCTRGQGPAARSRLTITASG
jgi:hypothetical protein